jgi:hypothetical protein
VAKNKTFTLLKLALMGTNLQEKKWKKFEKE